MNKNLFLISSFLLFHASIWAQNSSSAQEVVTPEFFIQALNNAARGDYDAMWEYIHKGGAIDTQDGNGITFLQVAVARGDQGATNQVKNLLKRNANPDVQNMLGFAPLHIAARPYPPNADMNIETWFRQSRVVTKLLLDARANPNIRNAYGVTPLHVAVNFMETEESLKKLGITRKPVLTGWEGKRKAQKSMEIAMIAGPAAGLGAIGVSVGPGGALLGAVIGGGIGLGIAKLTALSAKAELRQARREKVDNLIAAGANINAVDDFGNTPLHYLVASTLDTDAAIPIARKLVAAGANLDLRNKQGKTAWDIAKENNRIFIMPIIKPKSQRILPWRK